MSGNPRLSLEQHRRLGQIIQRLREERGLTIAQAARRANIDQAFWGRIEQGGKKAADGSLHPFGISDGAILKIVWCLGVTRPHEQRELFEAAGYPQLAPQPLQIAASTDPEKIEILGPDRDYTVQELEAISDAAMQAAIKKRQGVRRKRLTREESARRRADPAGD